jgi:hypothetical protein
LELLGKSQLQILYCLRDGDDFEKYRTFQESIVNSDLRGFQVVIICKSNDNNFINEVKALTNISSLQFFSVDDSGVYFEAFNKYFEFAKNLKFAILLSSDSKINDPNWANNLIFPIISGRTHLCGFMGSSESVSSVEFEKIRELSKAWFQSSNRILGESNHHQDFDYQAPERISSTLKNLKRFHLSFIPLIRLLHYSTFVILLMKSYKNLLRYPFFPNFHVRGTGVAVTRELLSAAHKGKGLSHMDAVEIESGRRGLSNLCRKFYSEPLICKDGKYFTLDSPEVTQTFRSDSGYLPAVADTHFYEYLSQSSSVKAKLRARTWG